MDASSEDLPELPGVAADHLLARPVDRWLDDDGRRAVAAVGGTAFDEPLHVFVQPVHVERAVLHAHVYVVCPGLGVGLAPFARQHVAGVTAEVVDGLVLFQVVRLPG